MNRLIKRVLNISKGALVVAAVCAFVSPSQASPQSANAPDLRVSNVLTSNATERGIYGEREHSSYPGESFHYSPNYGRSNNGGYNPNCNPKPPSVTVTPEPQPGLILLVGVLGIWGMVAYRKRQNGLS
jgi:hypothetical protein